MVEPRSQVKRTTTAIGWWLLMLYGFPISIGYDVVLTSSMSPSLRAVRVETAAYRKGDDASSLHVSRLP